MNAQRLQAVNELLNAWDPIGVAAWVDDEYEAYAPEVLRLLAADADAERLSAYLTGLALDQIGLPDTEGLRSGIEAATRSILAWWTAS